MGIFEGLEKFGLTKMSDMDIFDKEDKKKEKNESKQEIHEVTEEEVIFDKKYKCPVCDKEIKSKAVMTGKAKLISIDTDLRPKYQTVDCIKYDVVSCDGCGYSAVTRFFTGLTSQQVRLIKDNISANFKPMACDKPIYSYDDAILRFQLALACAVVKKGKMSERAYTCLKIAWLLRGKRENLDTSALDYADQCEELKKNENEFIKQAYAGFMQAMSKEMTPICGMDEYTFTYLLADLARRCKDYENSLRLLSQVITSRSAGQKIKDRARDLKDVIREEIKLNTKK